MFSSVSRISLYVSILYYLFIFWTSALHSSWFMVFAVLWWVVAVGGGWWPAVCCLLEEILGISKKKSLPALKFEVNLEVVAVVRHTLSPKI